MPFLAMCTSQGWEFGRPARILPEGKTGERLIEFGKQIIALVVTLAAVSVSVRLLFMSNGPLTAADVRDAIQQLYSTGRFADISVTGTRTAPGSPSASQPSPLTSSAGSAYKGKRSLLIGVSW